MGVRDMPRRSTNASSAMRLPAGKCPARISSRKRCWAFTACEPPSGATSVPSSLSMLPWGWMGWVAVDIRCVFLKAELNHFKDIDVYRIRQ
jgi:hypothetical protein